MIVNDSKMVCLKNDKKIAHFFICDLCDFKCSKQSEFNRHVLTLKHKTALTDSKKTPKTPKNPWICKCGKEYKYDSGFYRHRKVCKFIDEKSSSIQQDKKSDQVLEQEQIDYKSIVFQLIKENSDFKNQLIEIIPKIGNNNNNVKQKFNIQIFLNEKCKNALSIDEFIDKIEISMKNLLTTKDQGLGVGLSNIIIENMNKLSLYERPMHCTDKKRETLYIKNNGWKKDEDKQEVTNILKKIENKQIKSIKKWTDEHPNFLDDDKLQEEYMNLIRGCTTSIEACKEKAIKKICENVYVTE